MESKIIGLNLVALADSPERFDNKRLPIARSKRDILGMNKIYTRSPKSGFKEGYSLPRVLWLVRRDYTPEIVEHFSSFFSLFNSFPLKQVGSRNVTKFICRSSMMINSLISIKND